MTDHDSVGESTGASEGEHGVCGLCGQENQFCTCRVPKFVPASECRFTTRPCLELAIHESKGVDTTTHIEHYLSACRMVQVHMYMAMERPFPNLHAFLGLAPALDESSSPIWKH